MGQRLLLVDTDRGFLMDHQVSLGAAFDVEVAATPEAALARLVSGDFATVLVSAEVADNKGYSLCTAIRKNPALDGVKLALISAKATEEEYRRHQGLKGRADLYLHKPISPSALVAALSPLVPGRTLDPDNPLGELADMDLGEDWLEGLKHALDGPEVSASAPVFGVRPSTPAPTVSQAEPVDTGKLRHLEAQLATLQEELSARDQRLLAAEAEAQQVQRQLSSVTVNLDELERSRREAETQEAGRLGLLETQIATLQEELHTRNQRLLAAEAEAQQVQRQLSSVTVNLDELERSNREAEALKARLAETETALRSLEETRGREGDNAETLKAQLKESLQERTDLIQQVEALNHQVGEKALRAIELLKERDRLQGENLDLEAFRSKAQELEASLRACREELAELRSEAAARGEALAAREQAAQETQEQLAASQAELANQEGVLRGCREALAAAEQERADARRELALGQESLTQCQAELSARDAALAACQEELRAARQEREEALTAQGQLTATLEGLVEQQAGREDLYQAALLEVVTFKEKAQGLQLETAGLEATLRSQGRELVEQGVLLQQREQEAEAIRAQVFERDEQLQAKGAELQQHLEEVARLAAQLAELRQGFDQARLQHESEQLELMSGLDLKEAEVTQLNETLAEQREAREGVEREKQAIQGQLAEHRDRLQSLHGLLAEIQEQLRRGSDLTGC
ncbi:MAG: response regulator [Holophagaceae bacterium]|nr:response regulator [Holophagaceae bacterium]